MVNPKVQAALSQKQQSKKWKKNLPWYIGGGVAIFLCLVFFWHAENEAAAEREWALSYERRCEACQAMIVSGVMTRSMIAQQEKKRLDDERAENPDLPEVTEPPAPRATAVMRFMCEGQQIDQLLQHQPMRFGDGFTTADDNEFRDSLKKLCWMALSNQTTSRIVKKMLEAPMQPMQNPTLVAVASIHFEPVCMQRLSMCSQEQLDQGLVDTQAEERANTAGEGTSAGDYPHLDDATPGEGAAGDAVVGSGSGEVPADGFVPGEHQEL